MVKKDFKSVDSFSKIQTLMHLRWYINIHGFELTSENLHVDIDKLRLIKKINISDSTVISKYFNYLFQYPIL